MKLKDYKKVLDMLPHSWINKCIDVSETAGIISRVLVKSMRNWNAELKSGDTSLVRDNIKRDILQGNSLSWFLVMSSVKMVHLSIHP